MGFFVKIIIFIMLMGGTYRGVHEYMNMRQTKQTDECTTPDDLPRIRSDSVSSAEKHEISSRIYTCIKAKQNLADQLFFDIPDSWIK